MDELRPGRIVFVSNSLRMGGSQRVLLELVHAAIGSGLEVVVASRGGELAPAFRKAGARVLTLLMREGCAAERGEPSLSSLKTVVSMASVAQLAPLCRGQRTLLHASQPWPTGIASIVSGLSGAPLVWHAHGTSEVEIPAAFMTSVRKRAACWVGVSPEVTAALAALSAGCGVDVVTMRSPVSRSFGPEERRVGCPGVFGVLCTLTPNKRDYVFACIEAARMYAQHSSTTVTLKVVGDGPDRETVRRVADAAQQSCGLLCVETCGASMTPWMLLRDCEVVMAMGLVAIEGALRGQNVICASSDGVGGRLSCASWPQLSDTNFTGRSLRPLTASSLYEELVASIEAGVDSGLAMLAAQLHGRDAEERWTSLWTSILEGGI